MRATHDCLFTPWHSAASLFLFSPLMMPPLRHFADYFRDTPPAAADDADFAAIIIFAIDALSSLITLLPLYYMPYAI